MELSPRNKVWTPAISLNNPPYQADIVSDAMAMIPYSSVECDLEVNLNLTSLRSNQIAVSPDIQPEGCNGSLLQAYCLLSSNPTATPAIQSIEPGPGPAPRKAPVDRSERYQHLHL
ncbi:hypothetical protein ETB97_003333 [Aspergillus alliaceus]|uniref:Uncharacterized protein n=1 Tax=Petromyces alliaceus TaxID=209559 RepID=A0A8H5ZZE9_PETAA|nr:hypothetical protein ETB97_003333 [Aspergillus burnettii]